MKISRSPAPTKPSSDERKLSGKSKRTIASTLSTAYATEIHAVYRALGKNRDSYTATAAAVSILLDYRCHICRTT